MGKSVVKESIDIQTELLDKENNVVLVKLGGYIDQANVYLLQREIDQYIQNGYFKLIFDLGNLVYMSSAGWGVIIGEIKRFRENGGDIKLVNMNPEIYEIYRMLEFYHILPEYPTLKDALRSYGAAAVESGHTEQEMKGKKEEKEVTLFEEMRIPGEPDEPYEYKNSPAEGSEQNENNDEFEIQIKNLLQETTREDQDTKKNQTHIDFKPSERRSQLKEDILPLNEKIKLIVARNPLLSTRKIKKELRTERYGFVKIGYFKLRSILKQLELDTKEKRFRYYRSC
ncbi:MAG: hypothetical protein Kow0042_09500 [Calditrichia bacterium]